MDGELIALALSIAAAHGIDGPMFCRLIEAESAWKVGAVSSSGCVGLGQINRGAWLWWPDDPFEPKANLAQSARILRLMLFFYDGDPRKAVSAYNLGHGRMDALLAEHGDGWMDALPDHVRRYVERVVGEPQRCQNGVCAI